MSSTPLDYLPPDVEAELVYAQNYAYLAMASFAVYAYDWLLSIPGEVEICSEHGFGWSMAVYFLSRISEFVHGFLLIWTCLVNQNSCDGFWSAIGTAIAITIGSTSFLFLLRVRAVYLGSRNVTAVFGVLWLITMGLVILAAVTTHLGHAPGTELCGVITDTKYLPLPSISSFVNDTLIFMAIAYRLAANASIEHTWRSWIPDMLQSKGLFRMSRSLMQSGQLYYAAIILFFFLNLIYMASPLVPEIQKYTLVNTYVTFTNIMACRVFRGVALGMLVDSNTFMGSIRISASTTPSYPPPAAYNPTHLRE
ncbi:hypothetical protein FIBSPDRAFT_195126 [Athelia psychrophila]|uniref:DUF6533 domain-containing protein n=1 Tax=Athelia psychrophila TaxID=1759441 RepID=A0A166SLU8_9AGAM|nr:hypothetical protein FIBSPDRAFT_195126 [Fibularhizoctonia sp. CBS 109695]